MPAACEITQLKLHASIPSLHDRGASSKFNPFHIRPISAKKIFSTLNGIL